MKSRAGLAALTIAVLASACSSTSEPSDTGDVRVDVETDPSADTDTDTGAAVPVIPGTSVRMDLSRTDGFYTAPFPHHSLVRDGAVDLTAYPNPNNNQMVRRLVEIAGASSGFATTSTIYFTTDAPLSEGQLVDVHASIGAASPIWLINVDPDHPRYLERAPFDATFEVDGGPYGGDNMLALVPLQGVPLAPNSRYAAVVTTALTDANGQRLGRSDAVAQVMQSDAMTREAIIVVQQAGIDVGEIAALTVFETWDPTAGLLTALDLHRAETIAITQAPTLADEYEDYCVYALELGMPTLQRGDPPYSSTGGEWTLSPHGTPEVQAVETARMFVTIPRTAMPNAGYPLAVFIRTGGGGDVPLVQRGPRATNGGPPIELGTGPAIALSSIGVAGISIDGPHGGPRNVSNGDEQFLMFNVGNPLAIRDNIRQSAIELSRVLDVAESLTIDVSACDGAVAPDGARLAVDGATLMGHSMGATIAPLTFAIEPRYQALILSGAGGSWIANIMYKQLPLNVRPIAGGLLGYSGRQLEESDPALMLLQWAAEPADPPVYAWETLRSAAVPRHVLMLQGIVDTYILPPIANATSLSYGLDLAGGSLESTDPRSDVFRSLGSLLSFSGGSEVSFPVAANQARGSTAVVVQHVQGPIEDGHEVMFQTEAPKRQYRCFLESLYAGEAPQVVDRAGEWDACP